MRTVHWRLGAATAALLLGSLVASSVGAFAQSAPWRIVQATDGTIYLLKEGARFAIVGEPIEDAELAGYTDGGATGAAWLLGATPDSTPGGTNDAGPAASVPDAPQFVSVQGNSPGRTALVTVQAAPGSTCSIVYITPLGTRSTAAGLGPQSVGSSGTVTWSFLIGGNTRRGTGTITVTCGGATIRSPIQIG